MKENELLLVFEFLAKALKQDEAKTCSGEKNSPLEGLLTARPKYNIDLDDTTKTSHIKELMDRVDDKYKPTAEEELKHALAKQKKQFEDTVKALKSDILGALKSTDTDREEKGTDEPKTPLAVRFKDEFKHGFGKLKGLPE